MKFSQNFNVAKIIGNGITSLVCKALGGYLHILWCGLLSSFRDKGNARSLTKGIKAISSHTFSIEKRFFPGIGGYRLIMINQIKKQEFVTYEAPQVEVLEVQVEKGFAASEDPTITNPDMGWG